MREEGDLHEVVSSSFISTWVTWALTVPTLMNSSVPISAFDMPCRALLEKRTPGAMAQAVEDADTFFGIELPALTEWEFGPQQPAAIDQPVLGSQTQPLWVEVADFLRSSLPQVEELTIDGVGHLLHAQRPDPVARGTAEFLQQNAIARDQVPISL